MQVTQVWRYPVKSLQGERLDSVEVSAYGISGDRGWAIFDTVTGFGLTARRRPELLFASARLVDGGTVEITLPDGSVAASDADLSTWLGQPVALRSTAAVSERRYENPSDFEDEAAGGWEPFAGANGAFHDSGRANVSLLSTTTIGDWALRRFRANLILDATGGAPADEDALVGSRIGVGTTQLDVHMRIERCVMVTRPQPDGVARDLDVLRTIHRTRAGCLAVGATVAGPGRITAGDPVQA